MPAGISNPAPAPNADADSLNYEIGKNPPAFTILQRDTLAMTLPLLHMTYVNGETILNDRDCSEKIGRSLTKSTSDDLKQRRRISRSNDHLILANLQNHRVNPIEKKRRTKSHDNLDAVEKKNRLKDRDVVGENNIANRPEAMTLSTEDFNHVLNAKLRKIQDDGQTADRRVSRKIGNCGKKPFITTVKSGEFLMPPPEVAALLGMSPNGSWIGIADQNTEIGDDDLDSFPRSKFRPLASIGRRPEVRYSSHNSRCPAALKATVDFTANLVSSRNNINNNNNNNNISNNNSVDNTNGILCPNINRARRSKRFVNGETEFTMTQRALPKKLEPMEGMMSMLQSPCDQPLPFGNIMFDRRVVRGSTFASAPTLIDADESQAARQAEARRRQIAKKRAQSQASRSMTMMRIGSPPPVPGRKHEPVQTEMYLEELYDKPEESEVATQTDYFADRPATPIFCPGKTGQDAETQIAPGDLFDYDVEVQPILEVLVGKTIEQALIEVLEEEELAALREQQRRFRELRAAEKAEQQRLEEQERRLRDEKCRRVRQHEEAVKLQKETEERVAAAVLLTGYIAELLPGVLEGLKMSGFLLDEIKSDVEDGFMPWLMTEVKKEMGSVIESRELLMEIIREILENRAQTYSRLGEDYDRGREYSKSNDKSTSEILIPTDEGGEGHDSDFINYEPPVDVEDEPSIL